jgi:hypothetical protein
MNIHNRLNVDTFRGTYPLLKDFDSFKIVRGNVVFFKNEPCDECKANCEGANPVLFVTKEEPYEVKEVLDIITEAFAIGNSHRYTHRETVSVLEPNEETGGYSCWDCAEKSRN